MDDLTRCLDWADSGLPVQASLARDVIRGLMERLAAADASMLKAEAERDAAIERAEKAEAALAESDALMAESVEAMRQLGAKAQCVYCGRVSIESEESIPDHVAVCPKRPEAKLLLALAALEARHERTKAALAAMQEVRAGQLWENDSGHRSRVVVCDGRKARFEAVTETPAAIGDWPVAEVLRRLIRVDATMPEPEPVAVMQTRFALAAHARGDARFDELLAAHEAALRSALTAAPDAPPTTVTEKEPSDG